ncbi:MAG: hypothetical protein RLY66_38 [Candidatus Parcubacteria bacterium]
MKKHYYLLIAILALASFVPVVARAEEGTSTDSSGDVKPMLIREKLRVKMENEGDVRNKLLNARATTSIRIASTTREDRKDIRDERHEEAKDAREEMRDRIKSASSSEDRKEIRTSMHKNVFEIRKQALVKQLEVSLRNLKQIRDRIMSRIEKAEDAGKNMTEAKDLLVIADAKIVVAQTAINALGSFNATTTVTTTATSTDATATSTLDVDLTKPRQVGEIAIKAIKDAHRALVNVVVAIAHSLGGDKSATTTPPVIPPVTSTSTDTTTGTTTDSTTGTSTDTTI